ncbi:MAG: epoxyqueuosine reductase QueH [Candidatus Methylacidiphilaceae bacterium]
MRRRPTAPKFEVPAGETKVLLHSCCAPCSGAVMESILATGAELTVFFYNPNIHPRPEYELRKRENIAFAQKLSVPFVDADYDPSNWFARVRGLEWEPERGARCTVCFSLRFERTALYAAENDFPVFTSSLGISRWKDFDQVTQAGVRAASRYPGLTYWTYNWRKRGGSERMIALSRQEEFYQQEYCGCLYSLRDANRWRTSRGRPKIEFGKKFYGRPALETDPAARPPSPPPPA